MPRITCPVVIEEEVDELRQLERHLRGQPAAPRVYLLRLLKSSQVTPSVLSPYSPELNPAEQIMRVLRERLANELIADLDELDAAIEAVL